MPEIGTSGLMSGDGKRGDGQNPSHRAHPRLYHGVFDANLKIIGKLASGLGVAPAK